MYYVCIMLVCSDGALWVEENSVIGHIFLIFGLWICGFFHNFHIACTFLQYMKYSKI